MAQEILGLRDSEEFDLAGYDGIQASSLMHASFSDPVNLPPGQMIRVTFVIGGGKKVRQKYPETLAKDITQALAGMGFQEDRGACCSLECQGSFKYQHDTDKDLKFMHVFPRVVAEAAEAKEEEFGGDLPSGAARLMLGCPLFQFKELAKDNAPAFVQKRALLKVMKGVASRFEEFDKKLISMQTLEPEEQDLYSRGVSIGDKVEWLSGELEEMLVSGPLSKAEQLYVVADFQTKQDALEAILRDQQSKGKKVDKLQAQLKDLQDKCAGVAALQPPPVRRGPDLKELEELRKRIQQLNKIQDKKGLLSPDESKELAKKPNFEERLKKLESDSHTGWFESKVREVEALIKPKPESRRAPRPASATPSRPTTGRSTVAGGWSTSIGRSQGGSNASHGAKTTQNMYSLLGED
eukprot:CAMPEP_0196588154 /NCGR_PEP_ID=MMETSP1081-20130531/59713_1 /TAXON_ID=36882 /ORGANISM="Pyramimonas amylifera, Strain CCMP720" /LENGTH=408 /DNA_ID=CAMNT_0041910575 /DNA_START=92 /DNA_END=1318 /DNA_ORIENTATION=+